MQINVVVKIPPHKTAAGNQGTLKGTDSGHSPDADQPCSPEAAEPVPPSGRFTCVASATTCTKRIAIKTSGFLYRLKKFSMLLLWSVSQCGPHLRRPSFFHRILID